VILGGDKPRRYFLGRMPSAEKTNPMPHELCPAPSSFYPSPLSFTFRLLLFPTWSRLSLPKAASLAAV
jgi:hypothetical protein